MGFHLYVYDTSNLTEEYMLEHIGFFPRSRIDKISSLPNDEKRLSFGAGELLHEILPKYGYLDTDVSYEENGRPFVSDERDIHISISHSGRYSVLLVADSACAVDIEERKKPIDSIVRAGFTLEEKFLYTISEDKEAFFYETWNRKECLKKMVDFEHLHDIDTLSPMKYVGDGYVFTDLSEYFLGYSCNVLTKGVNNYGKKGKISWLTDSGISNRISSYSMGNRSNSSWS